MSVAAESSPKTPLITANKISHFSTSLVNRLSDAFWEARFGIQTAGDEQSLVARGNSQPLELRNRGGDRGMSWITLDTRNGKGRWLDDDRRARTTGHDCLEWLAGEREAQCVAHSCADVGDGVAGWRRPQHERVVLGGHDHEPRAGQQRNALHGTCR